MELLKDDGWERGDVVCVERVTSRATVSGRGASVGRHSDPDT